jgi:hypothetical protein
VFSKKYFFHVKIVLLDSGNVELDISYCLPYYFNLSFTANSQVCEILYILSHNFGTSKIYIYNFCVINFLINTIISRC